MQESTYLIVALFFGISFVAAITLVIFVVKDVFETQGQEDISSSNQNPVETQDVDLLINEGINAKTPDEMYFYNAKYHGYNKNGELK